MSALFCTSNSQGHVDYNIPLIAAKSTDYRTCTGNYHQFIPAIPQEFDCRVAAEIKPELKAVDVSIRNDRKSSYDNAYIALPNETGVVQGSNEPAPNAKEIHYIRDIQEKMYKSPPPPLTPPFSEMKDSYRMNYIMPRYREVQAPSTEGKCEIEGLARPLQPPIPPREHGHWKYLDIYMTNYRLDYPPRTKEEMEKAREDIITFYSASGKYKELKTPLPNTQTGNTSIYDKTFFKYQLPLRCLSNAPKNVPNMKFKTESNSSYVSQTYSDLYPYINENGVRFDDNLSEGGPWQNLCPPGMYCTEYCHIGTGLPIRAVVDIGAAPTGRHTSRNIET